MMMKNRSSLQHYLKELNEFTGRNVSDSDLISTHEMGLIRGQLNACPKLESIKFSVPFDYKSDKKFIEYINNLSSKNNSPIYIWTNSSNDCGLYLVESLMDINWDFKFEVNEGIVTFLAENLEDKLLLDFSLLNNMKVLDIEVYGKNWTKVEQLD